MFKTKMVFKFGGTLIRIGRNRKPNGCTLENVAAFFKLVLA